MRGSVFRIIFIVLAREFESIESPGFAWFLGENWLFQNHFEGKSPIIHD